MCQVSLHQQTFSLDQADMSSVLSTAFAFLVVFVIRRFFQDWTNRRKHGPYPPGPKPKFLIGNMFDFPITNAAASYVELGKKYNSDILFLTTLGHHLLIVNTREVADELFERRSRLYSDRPWIPITDLMGLEYNIPLMRYGQGWRMHRKICQQVLRQKAIGAFEPVQIHKVNKMLKGLLDTPDKFDQHSKMLSIGIPMSIMYGYEIESIDDPVITAADQSVILAAPLLLPGATIINILPLLRHIPSYFPGASSHKIAAKVSQLSSEMKRIPMDFVKKRMLEGTAVPSIVSDFLERKDTMGTSAEEEEAVKNMAFTVYGAASDTTISATGTFFFAMAASPQVQKRAQAELDRVIGTNRLPVFEDRPSLPYIEAIYREVLRFAPPLPLGVPHCLSEDDYYDGYFIPKGTAILGNIWAMTHDESVYSEPYEFKPERFFDANGDLNNDDRVLAYGFGRRVCVGQHVASSTLWIIIASVLASFNIMQKKDECGKEIEVNDEYYEFGIARHKKEFECSFTPRSGTSRKLVEEAKTEYL
ncbi:cytochrome P450 [Crassisporium funariophilum]|nr:cytochrome P450 [Crassisporium funariophilum]